MGMGVELVQVWLSSGCAVAIRGIGNWFESHHFGFWLNIRSQLASFKPFFIKKTRLWESILWFSHWLLAQIRFDLVICDQPNQEHPLTNFDAIWNSINGLVYFLIEHHHTTSEASAPLPLSGSQLPPIPPLPLHLGSPPHVTWGYFLAFSHIGPQGKEKYWLVQKIDQYCQYD
jgi:hypothetical protein